MTVDAFILFPVVLSKTILSSGEGTRGAARGGMFMPLIDIWNPDVSGDLLGLAMAGLATVVAVALILPSARTILRGRRRRTT